MQFLKAILLVGMIAFSGSSFALGALSRACFISELADRNLASPALLLFRYLGMPIQYYEVRNKSRRDQEQYAIFESITTDYGAVRYYLFAASRVYKTFKHPTYGTTEIRLHREYKSPWAAQTLDPEIFRDSRLSMFKFNRKVSSSVRAGNPDFVEQVDYRWDEERRMIVTGAHSYYDPATKATGALPDTSAFDCNLSEWGLEDR